MIHVGNCLDILPTLEAGSVHTCITSPPYFGLRDYGMAAQIGLEPTPAEFVDSMVRVFREVRRVLSDDGTVWLNLGDTYAGGGRGGNSDAITGRGANASQLSHAVFPGMQAKQLMGIPWRVAFALQADGWYLRQDIIWAKPNPMPESVTDRCTKSHEYIFLLSKGPKYYFDAGAISEPLADSSVDRLAQLNIDSQAGSNRVPGKTNGTMKDVGGAYSFARATATEGPPGQPKQHRSDREQVEYRDRRNKRSVWTVPTMPFKEAHFATFPEALIEPCVLAGAPMGGTVLDPFMGAGTTAVVAQRLGRQYVGCELNPEYADIARRRVAGTTMGLPFGEVA